MTKVYLLRGEYDKSYKAFKNLKLALDYLVQVENLWLQRSRSAYYSYMKTHESMSVKGEHENSEIYKYQIVRLDVIGIKDFAKMLDEIAVEKLKRFENPSIFL